MSMRIAVLSDIHGNHSALRNVLDDAETMGAEGFILLGDVIDYCMHSNEVIELLKRIDDKIICNIWGNHEHAIMNDEYSRFSSERGAVSARHTKSILTEASFDYIREKMDSKGKAELKIDGKKILCVHGGNGDDYWSAINTSSDLSSYEGYDYVLSGHSHLPHFFEQYYKVDDPKMRNKKKCIFINPGSVGQPRNHNNRSQYCIIDFGKEEIIFRKVDYDIDSEMEAFDGSVDDFYRERLRYGV